MRASNSRTILITYQTTLLSSLPCAVLGATKYLYVASGSAIFSPIGAVAKVQVTTFSLLGKESSLCNCEDIKVTGALFYWQSRKGRACRD